MPENSTQITETQSESLGLGLDSTRLPQRQGSGSLAKYLDNLRALRNGQRQRHEGQRQEQPHLIASCPGHKKNQHEISAKLDGITRDL